MNIIIKNQQLTVSINPKGAELTSLKRSGKEYIWDGNPEFWEKHSPILFPIVGTLKNNTYEYQGKEYSLSRHGFARDNEFTVKELSNESVTFLFTSNQNTFKVYPFEFQLELKYTLKDATLSLEYSVTNFGKNDMPFAIGAHPAFALPCSFSDYSLIFEKDETLISTQLENGLLSDKTIEIPLKNKELPLSYDLFKNDALIFKSTASNYIDIERNNDPYIRVILGNFPHLGIWTKEDAPFLCIEPWQGYSDSTNSNGNLFEKEGVITLKPNEKFSTTFSIEILS